MRSCGIHLSKKQIGKCLLLPADPEQAYDRFPPTRRFVVPAWLAAASRTRFCLSKPDL
jgi:hypothetical protein